MAKYKESLNDPTKEEWLYIQTSNHRLEIEDKLRSSYSVIQAVLFQTRLSAIKFK